VKALDLACGRGRHALWLAAHGWEVVAVDQLAQELPGVEYVQADIERHEFAIQPGVWSLIVCWLYWQQDLLASIANGVQSGGIVALAGKTTGRFATSLANYRSGFPGWTELASGEDESRAFFVASRGVPGEELVDQIPDLLRLFGVVNRCP
jgi:SAM-dependent methyltransferase